MPGHITFEEPLQSCMATPTKKFREFLDEVPVRKAVPVQKELPALPPFSSQEQSASRPTSSSGSSFFSFGIKRSGSTSSTASKRSNSRRGSLADSIKEKAAIIAMDKGERQKWVAQRRISWDRVNEVTRQEHPEHRTEDQKAYIREKKFGIRPMSQILDIAQVNAMAEHDEHQRLVAKAHHKLACEEAARDGEPRPRTPEDATTVKLTSPERMALGHDSEQFPLELSVFTEAALSISRWADKYKTRQQSDASDMSFADCAPSGSMQRCGEAAGPWQGKGCNKPCKGYLKEEPPVFHRIEGHAPKSPPEDVNHGELYMRLAGGKKLRKVRNTIYQDPGNPFSMEDVPSSQDRAISAQYEKASDDRLSACWESQGGYNYYDASHAVQHEYSDTSNPELTSDESEGRYSPEPLPFIYTPTPHCGQRMEFASGDRRSISVDIAFLPSWTDQTADADETYEPMTRGWRSDSLPTLHTQAPSEVASKADRRDTDCYAFYDDLLAEYGIQESYW